MNQHWRDGFAAGLDVLTDVMKAMERQCAADKPHDHALLRRVQAAVKLMDEAQPLTSTSEFEAGARAMREECAKVADLVAARWSAVHSVAPAAAKEVASAIRALPLPEPPASEAAEPKIHWAGVCDARGSRTMAHIIPAGETRCTACGWEPTPADSQTKENPNRLWYCNKCGYAGPKGPLHSGCNYHAAYVPERAEDLAGHTLPIRADPSVPPGEIRFEHPDGSVDVVRFAGQASAKENEKP